jgi:hypothetical protein
VRNKVSYPYKIKGESRAKSIIFHGKLKKYERELMNLNKIKHEK